VEDGRSLAEKAHALSIWNAVLRRMQAPTEHRGLNACLFRKKLADSPIRECGCGGDTVPHVLLRRGQFAEARTVSRGAADDSRSDVSYVLGGWNGLEYASPGKETDGSSDDLQIRLPTPQKSCEKCPAYEGASVN
jgi:hypothetical protein